MTPNMIWLLAISATWCANVALGTTAVSIGALELPRLPLGKAGLFSFSLPVLFANRTDVVEDVDLGVGLGLDLPLPLPSVDLDTKSSG